VLVVETGDSVGPMGSKGIAESNVNPVAPALANALHDATGVRYRELPLTPERIYRNLVDNRLIPAT
jgi:CO/xanthine dehydrogenase Mo-binding subunit